MRKQLPFLFRRFGMTAALTVIGLFGYTNEIQPQSRSLNINDVQDVIRGFVQEKLRLSNGELLIEISGLHNRLNGGEIYDEVKVLPTRNPVRKGVQLIRCGLFFRSQLQEKIQARVRVRTFQFVVVSNANIARHEVLRPEMFQLAKRETTNLTRTIFTSITDIAGLRTKRMVRTGEIIVGNLVEALPVIARGSEVEIHFRKGSLDIVLPGIAREDGQPGGTLRVQCLENRRNYKAEVIDSSNVIVNL